MSKEKKFNVLDSIAAEFSGKVPVLLRKAQRVSGGWLLRLSNKATQLITDSQSYLLLSKKLWEVTGGKEKELSYSKLVAETLRGPNESLKALRKVAIELEAREESSKENTRAK